MGHRECLLGRPQRRVRAHIRMRILLPWFGTQLRKKIESRNCELLHMFLADSPANVPALRTSEAPQYRRRRDMIFRARRRICRAQVRECRRRGRSQMTKLQERIEFLSASSISISTQLSELSRLKEQLRKAQAAAFKSIKHKSIGQSKTSQTS